MVCLPDACVKMPNSKQSRHVGLAAPAKAKQHSTPTSGCSSKPPFFESLKQLQEQLDIPDNDAPLSNGVFRRSFSQVFSMIFQHCIELANNVDQLAEQNRQLKADIQSQQVEMQLLRDQVTSLNSALHSTGGVNTSSNVLVHAIQESPNETLFDMRRVALQHLRSLDISTPIQPADIMTVNRLGLQLSQVCNRQRPLVVRLKSSALCKQLANASYKKYVSDRKAAQGKPYVTLHTANRSVKRSLVDINKFKSLDVAKSGERRQRGDCQHT